MQENKFKFILVFLFLALTMSFVSAALTDGLKGYWNFDEAASSTLIDSLGFYNGTTTGATVNQPGKINKSYYFDGVNDFITHGSDALGSLYSISLWIKIDTNTANYNVLAGQGSSNPNAWQPGLTFYNVDNSLRYAGNYNDSSISTGVSSILDATWYHVVVTANDKNAKIYLNGVLDENVTSLNTKAWTQLRFIARKDTGDYFKGYIDEMGIWNKELSQLEITQLYNSGSGNTYPFSVGLYTPTASVPTGTYYDPFQVTLDNNSTIDIYYTLDGSTPDDTKTLYTEPININETKTLKAISWVSDENKSLIATYTYTIREPITTITFRDENTLAIIPTVTITDANGSTYTSDDSGVLTTSWSNIAKSLIISKTGYDSRPLQFYFKREDFDYNFLLTLDGNSVNIGFIVKDTNDNLWGNKYLVFKKGTNIINSLLTSSSGTGAATLPIDSFVNNDYNALLYDATGTYVEEATLIPYLLKLNFNTDTNATLANVDNIIEFTDVTNLIYSLNALPLNSNILTTFNNGFQFYEFYNAGDYLIDVNVQLFDLNDEDQNQLDKVYIGTRNKFAIIVPDAQITVYKQKEGASEWITIGQRITDDSGLNYIYTNENDLIKIIATKEGYEIGSRITAANEFWGSYTNILWVTINETETNSSNGIFNTYLNYNRIDPITKKRVYNTDINGIYATITANLSSWLRLEIYEEGVLVDSLNEQGYYNYLDINVETPNDYNFLYYAMNTDTDYELIDYIELICDVNATSPFEDRDLLYREDLQEANTTNKTRTLVLILILICLSALATMIKAELLVFFVGAMIFSLLDISFLLVAITGLIYIVFNQYIKKLLYDN
ncbi:MAG TPA: FN3 associated domain-containing protein [Clostridia bacterium]|nr:FN3 associated domain-containing protein [Clostridia bacterium]